VKLLWPDGRMAGWPDGRMAVNPRLASMLRKILGVVSNVRWGRADHLPKLERIAVL
jgi:hypothetical protein